MKDRSKEILKKHSENPKMTNIFNICQDCKKNKDLYYFRSKNICKTCASNKKYKNVNNIKNMNRHFTYYD